MGKKMGLRYLIFYSQQTITFSKSTTETEKRIAICLKLTIRTVQCLQTYHVYPTLKRRGNGRFHVVSTRNTCDVFVGIILVSEHISHLYYIYISHRVSIVYFEQVNIFWVGLVFQSKNRNLLTP